MRFDWSSLSRRLPPGWWLSLPLVLILTSIIANSTVAASWVPSSQALIQIALVGVLVMGLLAVAKFIPWPVALGIGAVLAPFAAFLFALPTLHAAHPGDPYGLAAVPVWISRMRASSSANDLPFFLYVLCLLFWAVGGWLSWCVLRWRQPLLGLVPGAAAFATTVLNYPADQNSFVLGFLVFTLGLLLWNNFQRSIDTARRFRLRISSDARWDFGETGGALMAAVIALGIFLPPLSSDDRTLNFDSATLHSWAEFQQTLNHQVPIGRGGNGVPTSIGFNNDVPLGGPIHKTGGVVFTYTIDGTYTGPRYFRGTNVIRTDSGQWREAREYSVKQPLARDETLTYPEIYKSTDGAQLKLSMVKPPRTASDAIFYPGQLYKVDRDTVALTEFSPGFSAPPGLTTVDRVSSIRPPNGSGTYKLQVEYSIATDQELRAAGTNYPGWTYSYRFLPGLPTTVDLPNGTQRSFTVPGRYRPAATEQQIQQLALQITAGATNPYDKAAAIESYLRTNYTYTLTPNDPPTGSDPMDYFLFKTKQGYCEYFASAMGDLLRSLGIPTRLVNGYGPGTWDEHGGKYVVKESDAHTWVEVYFPAYGWIPFEPTADGSYFPIPRSSNETGICPPESVDCVPADPGVADPGGVTKPGRDEGLDAGPGGSSGGLTWTAPVIWGPALAGLLVLLLALYVFIRQFLRPRTVGTVWRRAATLSRLAGARLAGGETPLEFGERMGAQFPEATSPAEALARGYAIAAYAPKAVAERSRESVMAAWEELRPLLLRRVYQRLRPSTYRA
jgi:transglutaminase-like putative cysteine protease